MRETQSALDVGDAVAPTTGTRKLNSNPFIVTSHSDEAYTLSLLTPTSVEETTVDESDVVIDSDEQIDGKSVIHIQSGSIAGTYTKCEPVSDMSEIDALYDYSDGNKTVYVLPHTMSETTIPLVSLSGSVVVNMSVTTIKRRILLGEAEVKTAREVISDTLSIRTHDGAYTTENGVTFDDPMHCLMFHAGVSVGLTMPRQQQKKKQKP